MYVALQKPFLPRKRNLTLKRSSPNFRNTHRKVNSTPKWWQHIVQLKLNGRPDFNSEGLLARSRTEYKEPSTLTEMIKEDLIAERIAVEFYSEVIYWLGDGDLTTRKIMQDIRAVEAQHAEDMKELLGKLTESESRMQPLAGNGRSGAPS